jgi:hypothetical protein
VPDLSRRRLWQLRATIGLNRRAEARTHLAAAMDDFPEPASRKKTRLLRQLLKVVLQFRIMQIG